MTRRQEGAVESVLSFQQRLLRLGSHDLVLRYKDVVRNVDDKVRLCKLFQLEILRHACDDLLVRLLSNSVVCYKGCLLTFRAEGVIVPLKTMMPRWMPFCCKTSKNLNASSTVSEEW